MCVTRGGLKNDKLTRVPFREKKKWREHVRMTDRLKARLLLIGITFHISTTR